MMKIRKKFRDKKENEMNRSYSFSFSLLANLTSLISSCIKLLVLVSFGGTLTVLVSLLGCQVAP